MAKVLLLEPDRRLAASAQTYLGQAGHQVATYVDLQAAITAADTQPPDIVITNLILAGRSASEFLYELRSYPDWQRLPVIILSHLPAGELDGYLPALRQLGVSRCLQKADTSLQQLADEIDYQLKP